MAQIPVPPPPNLPLAPDEFNRQYQEQLNKDFRLYFNRLTAVVRQLLLGFNNYGTFYDTQTRTNPVANAENLAPFDTTAEAYGITLEGTPATKFVVSKPGVYNFQFSSQLDHSGGGAVSFYFWFKRNGTAIPYTAGKAVVDGPNAETIVTWNFLVTLAAGDYVELAWSATGTNAVLLAAAAAPPVPAIPSTIMTVTYVYPNDIG